MSFGDEHVGIERLDDRLHDADAWNARAAALVSDADDYRPLLDLLRTASLTHDPVDFATLSSVVERISESVISSGDAGEQVGEVLEGLDLALTLAGNAGVGIAELELAKAQFLFNFEASGERRRSALLSARSHSRLGSLARAKADFLYAYFLIDGDDYVAAAEELGHLEGTATATAGALAGPYRLGLDIHRAALYVTWFRHLRAARVLLDRALAAADARSLDEIEQRWMATAIHYRGRLAEMRGFYGTALDLYHESERLRRRGPTEPVAAAFYHLRVAELLAGRGTRSQARAHLSHAQDLIATVGHRGSAYLQAGLLELTLSPPSSTAADAAATRIALERLRETARDQKFHRGELLCNAAILGLAVRERNADLFRQTAIAVVRTLGSSDSGLLTALPALVRAAAVRQGLTAIAGRLSSRGHDLTLICDCELHPTW